MLKNKGFIAISALVAFSIVGMPFLVLADNRFADDQKYDSGSTTQYMRPKMNEGESNVGSTSEKIKQQMEQDREVIKQEREKEHEDMMKERDDFEHASSTRIANFKKHIGDQRAKTVDMLFGNMVGKFNSAIDRLNSLADRIQARLDVLSQNGKDVTTLNTKLAAARVKISDAVAALQTAKSKYTNIAQNPDPALAFQSVKQIIKDAEQKVKDAHAALVDVTSSVKGEED